MDLTVKAHQTDISGELRAFIERKVSKLDRYLDRVTDARLELRQWQPRTGGVRHVAQLTIATNFALLRAEEEAGDPHAAVDAVATKMERQIARYRNKWKSRRVGHHASEPALPELAQAPELDALEEETPSPIVRTKTFSSKPMDAEEAVEQMELLGHTFFAFIDSRSGTVNVVYRRRTGGYGLLQPQ